jgi:hypothetical protein
MEIHSERGGSRKKLTGDKIKEFQSAKRGCVRRRRRRRERERERERETKSET